jgi:hypothetical protein
MQEIAVVRNTKLEQFVVVFVLALEGILGNFIEKVQLKKNGAMSFHQLNTLHFPMLLTFSFANLCGHFIDGHLGYRNCIYSTDISSNHYIQSVCLQSFFALKHQAPEQE